MSLLYLFIYLFICAPTWGTCPGPVLPAARWGRRSRPRAARRAPRAATAARAWCRTAAWQAVGASAQRQRSGFEQISQGIEDCAQKAAWVGGPIAWCCATAWQGEMWWCRVDCFSGRQRKLLQTAGMAVRKSTAPYPRQRGDSVNALLRTTVRNHPVTYLYEHVVHDVVVRPLQSVHVFMAISQLYFQTTNKPNTSPARTCMSTLSMTS